MTVSSAGQELAAPPQHCGQHHILHSQAVHTSQQVTIGPDSNIQNSRYSSHFSTCKQWFVLSNRIVEEDIQKIQNIPNIQKPKKPSFPTSSLNFFIYCFVSKSFRKSLGKLLSISSCSVKRATAQVLPSLNCPGWLNQLFDHISYLNLPSTLYGMRILSPSYYVIWTNPLCIRITNQQVLTSCSPTKSPKFGIIISPGFHCYRNCLNSNLNYRDLNNNINNTGPDKDRQSGCGRHKTLKECMTQKKCATKKEGFCSIIGRRKSGRWEMEHLIKISDQI